LIETKSASIHDYLGYADFTPLMKLLC